VGAGPAWFALTAIVVLLALEAHGTTAAWSRVTGTGVYVDPHSLYSGPNDAALRACQEALADCNPAATEAIAATNPPYQPPSANPQSLSRAVVEAAARSGARTPLTPEAPLSAVVYSALMPRSQVAALFLGAASNPGLDQTRLEWVITVHAPMATDGSPGMGPEVKPVYSVALDAETGQWTDACIGCAWLDVSQ
jgi:hypothetical protein